MDTKRLVIGMLLAMAVVLGWQVMLSFLAQKYHWSLGPTPTTQSAPATTTAPTTQPDDLVTPTTQPAEAPSTNPAAPLAPASMAAAPTTGPGAVRIATTSPASQEVHLGIVTLTKGEKQKPAYPLGLAISAQGAGIESATLNQFWKSVPRKGEKPEPYVYQEPYAGHVEQSRSLATRSVSLDGKSVDLTNVAWALENHTEAEATYYVDLEGPGGTLRIHKTYQLSTSGSDAMGYEVLVRYRFENRGTTSVSVSTAFNGPTVPPKEFDNDYRQVIAGYWDKDQVKVESEMVTAFGPKMTSKDWMVESHQLPILWAGTSSVYFDAIVQPEIRSGRTPDYLASVQATALDPNAQDAEQRQVLVTFQTKEMEVPAGGEANLSLNVFFGPKTRAVLESGYYSAAFRSYDKTLATLSSGCGSRCTFGWLISGMVGLLSFFHVIFRDWGLAIIGLVVVVRLLLHPLTKRSTISMQKMGKMAPEMERLKKKYGDNKEELNKAMWEFQKQQGLTPVLGCLPMFLQMPIWIALWQTLQNTFELRQAPFLWGFTWIKDLSQPDRLISFGTGIPIIFTTIDAINLLPIVLAVVFYLQQKFTPKPPATTPEQEQQQKMMQWMSLLFPVFFYKMPSGLNLYILTSTTIGIIESKRIRDHIKQRDEAEKAGKVIVETKPTRASRKRLMDKDEPPKSGGNGLLGGLMRWISGVGGWADQIRRDAENRK